MTFAGEVVTLLQGGKEKSSGTFAVDESKTPRRITMTGKSGANSGTTFEAVYELDGDTLKLAYGLRDSAGTPPKDFNGGAGEASEVFERQKP